VTHNSESGLHWTIGGGVVSGESVTAGSQLLATPVRGWFTR